MFTAVWCLYLSLLPSLPPSLSPSLSLSLVRARALSPSLSLSRSLSPCWLHEEGMEQDGYRRRDSLRDTEGDKERGAVSFQGWGIGVELEGDGGRGVKSLGNLSL